MGAIDLSEMADFEYNFVKKTLYKRANLVAHLTSFSFEFFFCELLKRSSSVVNFKRHPAPQLSPLHRNQSPLLRSGQRTRRGAALP